MVDQLGRRHGARAGGKISARRAEIRAARQSLTSIVQMPGEIMSSSRPTIADKRKTFRKLHEAGCFVIPNPWNVGTARYLQGLGFKALATTSAGHAHALGFPDGGAEPRRRARALPRAGRGDRRAAQRRFRERLCRRSRRRGRQRDALHRDRRRRTVDRGFAERCDTPLYDFDSAGGAREGRARRRSTVPAATWCSPRARRISSAACTDLDDVIRRLKAYAAAGADCLYAPGIKTREQIEAVVKAVAPKPVNFLDGGAFGFTVSDLAAMGVRRISVGGSLARVAMHAFIRSRDRDRQRGQIRRLRRARSPTPS